MYWVVQNLPLPGIPQKNSDNLTKAAAMQVIRELTGFPDEEILEVSNNGMAPKDTNLF
jgi:hypothetical protein